MMKRAVCALRTVAIIVGYVNPVYHNDGAKFPGRCVHNWLNGELRVSICGALWYGVKHTFARTHAVGYNGEIMADTPRVPRVFLERVITLIITSFGLVVALAWNEAIQALVKEFFPEQQGIAAKFIYALVITFVLVFVSVRLGRLTDEHT